MNITPELKIYALCTVILFYKMWGTGLYQALSRVKAKKFTNEEDAKSFGGELTDKEIPQIEKAYKAYRNDFENIPPFLFMGICYVLLGCWPKGAFIYFPLFTVARIGHTVFYIKSNQPLRSLCYGIGLMATIAVSVHVFINSF